MKRFTSLAQRLKANSKARFAAEVLFFLVLLLVLYVYLMFADLSTAPEFVYSQF